jgi:ubiquinol oxidase
MPYFSYIFMLHTYETLGWWRRSAEAKRVHFAEEFNEYNHLLIMEALGGDQKWRVRFFAQHSAILYYFTLLFLWVMSPSLAYNFSELIEAHAVDTYEEFAESNKELLQTMAAPEVAKAYYENPDMYIFDEFQTGIEKGVRRPVVNTLYDVFCNIRDDERAHVKTMAQCQDPAVVVRSPNTEAAIAIAAAAGAAVVGYLSYGALNFDVTEFVSNAPVAFDEMVAGAASTVGAASEAASGLSGEAATFMESADSNAEVVESAVEGGMLSALLRYLSTFIPFLF